MVSYSGSRGSRHSTDSGTTSDSAGETKDCVFEEPGSPFRSSMEMSPPVSPTTPTMFQKAYISKVNSVTTLSCLVMMFMKPHVSSSFQDNLNSYLDDVPTVLYCLL